MSSSFYIYETVEDYMKFYPSGQPNDFETPVEHLILKNDNTLRACKTFTVHVQVLDHPGELKIGYTPVAFVRTGRSPVRISQINWKMGKETGGKKLENPVCIKANEMGEIVFEAKMPFVVDKFQDCEGLGRVAIMEGKGVIMLGKVIDVEHVEKVTKK